MKRIMSLLLCLLLLAGAAQAQGLKPSRFADGAIGKTSGSSAQAEATEDETMPEPAELGRISGYFSVAEVVEAEQWQFEAVLTRVETADEMALGAAELSLEAWAQPVQGEGARLECSFWGVENLRFTSELTDVVCPIATASLKCLDAQNGNVQAHYMLELLENGVLDLRDAQTQESVWSAQLPYGLANMLTTYDVDMALSMMTIVVMISGADYQPLADALAPLWDGQTVTVNLREALLPLSQMAGLSLGELFPQYAPALKNSEISRTLAHLLRGAVTIAPEGDGLRAVYYSEGSPELSAVKAELEVGEGYACLQLYENADGGYVTVARADLTLGEDALRLRAEDYVGGGFVYLDVDVPVYADGQTQSLTARLSASSCTGGEVMHARLELSRVPDDYARAMRPDAPLPCSASLILSGENSPTHYSLRFNETFSGGQLNG